MNKIAIAAFAAIMGSLAAGQAQAASFPTIPVLKRPTIVAPTLPTLNLPATSRHVALPRFRGR